MSIPGVLLGRFRQRFGHGLRVAYYRDIVRPRILRTAPITGLDDFVCEAHVLTSAGDWLNLIWTLKSFYRYAGRRYALCIHEDGSVPSKGIKQLRHHFPDARLVRRAEADQKAFAELAQYPRCLAFRKTNLLAPKVFDFVTELRSNRMLLLDSDVLFFAEPKELLRRIEDRTYRLNTVNGDIASAYAVDPAVVKQQTGVNLIERFNSGLGLIHKGSMRLDWVEEFLALPGIGEGHFWRIEQTLFALCSSRWGVELLPETYDVKLGNGIDSPGRHYVGAIRHLMYGEGIAKLSQSGFLSSSENQAIR